MDVAYSSGRLRLNHAWWFLAGLVGSAILISVLVWVGMTRWSWAWYFVILPALYLLTSIGYRYEPRLPAWASRGLALLAENLSTIAWLKRMLDVRDGNALLIRDLSHTLDEYSLGTICDVSRRRLERRGHLLTIRALARKVAPELPESLDPRCLELLHRERCGLPTMNLWQSHKDDIAELLAPILPRSERLPVQTATYRYEETDNVEMLLNALRDFEVDLVARELRELISLAGRRGRFVDFLDESGISVEEEVPDTGSLAKSIAERNGLPADSATMFRLDDPHFAIEYMEQADTSTGGDGLRKIHLGVFLAERESDCDEQLDRLSRSTAPDASEQDGGPDPVEVLHAYLWEKQRRAARGGLIRLNEVDAEWTDWEALAEEQLGSEAHTQEHGRIRSQLATGCWPTIRDSEGRFETAQVMPSHDEVRELDTYLITFDERRGPVANLVDCLSKNNSIHRKLKDILETLGIQFAVEGYELYRFGGFTKNTRLGIVPPGMPFHLFHETFFKDMELVLRNRERLFPNWLPERGSGVFDIEYGDHRTIELRDTRKGPIEFRILPRAEALPASERFRTSHGSLTGDPQNTSLNRAVATFVADPSSRENGGIVDDRFDYECISPGGVARKQTALLRIHPRWPKPIAQFEITLNRIDLEHCWELRFGDEELGGLARPPSIGDVWRDISNSLTPSEREKVRQAFNRVAGGPCCT